MFVAMFREELMVSFSFILQLCLHLKNHCNCCGLWIIMINEVQWLCLEIYRECPPKAPQREMLNGDARFPGE